VELVVRLLERVADLEHVLTVFSLANEFAELEEVLLTSPMAAEVTEPALGNFLLADEALLGVVLSRGGGSELENGVVDVEVDSELVDGHLVDVALDLGLPDQAFEHALDGQLATLVLAMKVQVALAAAPTNHARLLLRGVGVAGSLARAVEGAMV